MSPRRALVCLVEIIGRGLDSIRGSDSGAGWVTWVMRVWRPRGAVACAELGLPAGRPDDGSACWKQLDQARVYARTEARLAGMVKRMHTRYGASTHGRITGSQQPAHRLAAFKSGLQLGDSIESPLRLDEVIIWCDGESPSRRH